MSEVEAPAWTEKRRLIGIAPKVPGKQMALMDGTDDKVGYWLTPPEDLEALVAEFGELYDPCPYPRPAGWDGLREDWPGRVCYVNPPFEGPGTGFSKWARKCVEQAEGGRTVILIYPVLSWLSTLLKAGAEVRPLGTREWVRPDGKRRRSPSPVCYFILRPPKGSP
jgi:hypothetical protein